MADVEMRPAGQPEGAMLWGHKKLALLVAAGCVFGFALGWVLNLMTGADNPLGLGALGLCVGGLGGALVSRLMDRDFK